MQHCRHPETMPAEPAGQYHSWEACDAYRSGPLPFGLPLRVQMREELYQILGGLASSVASFYQAAAAQPAWAAALVGDLDMLTNPHLRLAMRHIYIPLVKACPPSHRQAASCQHLTRDGGVRC